MESSRTSSRTHFKVLGLEASSPQKLACPRLEVSTIFWIVKILWSSWKIFWKTCFSGDRLKNFCEELFFFGDHLKNFSEDLCAFFLFLRSPEKKFLETFFGEHLRLCPWPQAFLSLAWRGSVLGRAVLGLGFFCVLGPEPCVLVSTSVF